MASILLFFFGRVPRWVWELVAVVVLLGLLWFWWDGKKESLRQEGYDARQAELDKAERNLAMKRGKITQQVVVKYVDRIVTVRQKAERILVEVPVYVTPDADAACTINNGFVRLWNDSNAGEVSDSASGADAASSEVVLSDVGAQKAIEAGICRETEERLIALQEWVLKQSEVEDGR